MRSRLIRERADGLLARLWVLPVHRASGLLSRFVAEAVRIVVTTVVILCAGLLLGFRFQQGRPARWPGYGSGGLRVGIRDAGHHGRFLFGDNDSGRGDRTGRYAGHLLLHRIRAAGTVSEWIQPVVEHQPMSYAIEAMRGLSLGGPILWPMTATCLWAGGIVAVCVVPMVIGYRKASMR